MQNSAERHWYIFWNLLLSTSCRNGLILEINGQLFETHVMCTFPKSSLNILKGHWWNISWETFPGIIPFLERQKKAHAIVGIKIVCWSSVKTYNCPYKHRTIPQSSLALDTRHQHQTKSSLMSRLPPGDYGKNWTWIIFTLWLTKFFFLQKYQNI